MNVNNVEELEAMRRDAHSLGAGDTFSHNEAERFVNKVMNHGTVTEEEAAKVRAYFNSMLLLAVQRGQHKRCQ